MSLIVEIFNYLMTQKKLWLFPVIIVLLIIGGLLVVAQGSIMAPFIYALF